MLSPQGLHTKYARYLKPIFTMDTDDLIFVTNRVYLNPIAIPFKVVVDRILVHYRSPVAGNIQVAIYNDNGDTPVGGSLLISSASVAKTGTFRRHEIAIADTTLNPGLYWGAIQSDENTTVTRRELDPVASTLQGHYYDPVGYVFTNPCPATANGSVALYWLRVKSLPAY